MADEYARMKGGTGTIVRYKTHDFHLDVLKRRALSRQRGDSDWYKKT
jgi:hypothetical protein